MVIPQRNLMELWPSPINIRMWKKGSATLLQLTVLNHHWKTNLICSSIQNQGFYQINFQINRISYDFMVLDKSKFALVLDYLIFLWHFFYNLTCNRQSEWKSNWYLHVSLVCLPLNTLLHGFTVQSAWIQKSYRGCVVVLWLCFVSHRKIHSPLSLDLI